MKTYLYNAVLNQKTLHNKLIREKEIIYEDGEITSPEKVFKIMTTVFGLHRMAEEHVFMIALNTKARPIGFFEISHGTVNMSLVTPREIYIRAVLVGATSIIIVHNHPSQDCTASTEDIKLTTRLKEAGSLLGIVLLDHIIIGRAYCSLKERGVI